jgi:ribosomal protein S18 acetylase RimI-like enzyme
MQIRKAKKSDIDKINKIGNNVNEFRVSEKVVTFWPRNILLDLIKSKTGLILVAEENEDVLGFVIANYNPTFRKAIIENIFVQEKYRKQDIGKRLLTSLLKQLKSIGCEYVCTLVESKSSRAIDFYIENNFKEGIECVWLDKILNKSFRRT